MLRRRGSVLLFAVLVLSACGSRPSEPMLEARLTLGPESSTRETVEVGEVEAGRTFMEVATSRDIHYALSVRTPSTPEFSYTSDAQHGGFCQELGAGIPECGVSREHGEIPAGTWELSATNQSDVAASIEVRVIDGRSGWGVTGAVWVMAVILVAAFSVWWRRTDRGRLEGQPVSDDPTESRERLGLLRARSMQRPP